MDIMKYIRDERSGTGKHLRNNLEPTKFKKIKGGVRAWIS